MLISNMNYYVLKTKNKFKLIITKNYKNNAYLFTLILERKHSQNTNFVQSY